jgi:hypothetical protein
MSYEIAEEALPVIACSAWFLQMVFTKRERGHVSLHNDIILKKAKMGYFFPIDAVSGVS